jgi:hypothetical protein
MPNWCFNHAEFAFPDKETYNKFILAVLDESLFATFAPLELDSDKTWSIEKAVEKWGTKWEPSEWQNVEPTPFIESPEYIIIANFDTAWAPPIGFYECLMNDHNIQVNAMFHEGGEEIFGKCVYNEIISKNTYFNYPRSESQLFRVRQDIGINGELDSFMSCEWDRLLEIWEEKSDEDSI